MMPVDATNLICWDRAPAVQCTRLYSSFGAAVGLQWDEAALPENIVKYLFWKLSLSLSLSFLLSSSFISTTHGMLRVLPRVQISCGLSIDGLLISFVLTSSPSCQSQGPRFQSYFEEEEGNILLFLFLTIINTVSVLLVVVPDCCYNLY